MTDLPRIEIMNPNFYKVFDPNGTVWHYLRGEDRGDPHDHPFDISIKVISGGYIEEVFGYQGRSTFVVRNVGDEFVLPSYHVHRIVGQLGLQTVTHCVYHEGWVPWSFFRWRDGIRERRQHDWAHDDWRVA